ncbi:MAG: hypothetical protein ACYCQI_08585 [Gammaproteobacteria bacterium]
MSIIYDALQKTQRQLNNKNQFDYPKSRRNWFDIILRVAIVILLFLVTLTYYPKIKSYFMQGKHQSLQVAQKNPPATTVAPTPRPLPYQPPKKLVLNGIFISDQESLALINDRLLKIGESVDGSKVVNITTKQVTMEAEGHLFVLESPS